MAFGYIAFNHIDYFTINSGDSKTLLIAGAGLVVGSIISDIDHGNSFISRRLGFLSKLPSKVFKHRGFTHSILGMIIMTGLLNLIFKKIGIRASYLSALTKGFFIGVASHVFLDMLTPNGVQLFYPIKKRIKLTTGFIKDYSDLNKKEIWIIVILIIAVFISNYLK